MIRKIFFILIFLIAVCFSEEPAYCRVVDKISMKFSQEMEKRYGLLCGGGGGEFIDDIKSISLGFMGYQNIDINRARSIAVEAWRLLIDMINNEREIRSSLHQYPFTAENVVLTFSFVQKEGQIFVDIPHIAGVLCSGSTIDYFVNMPRLTDGKSMPAANLVKVGEDSYKKAQQILKNQEFLAPHNDSDRHAAYREMYDSFRRIISDETICKAFIEKIKDIPLSTKMTHDFNAMTLSMQEAQKVILERGAQMTKCIDEAEVGSLFNPKILQNSRKRNEFLVRIKKLIKDFETNQKAYSLYREKLTQVLENTELNCVSIKKKFVKMYNDHTDVIEAFGDKLENDQICLIKSIEKFLELLNANQRKFYLVNDRIVFSDKKLELRANNLYEKIFDYFDKDSNNHNEIDRLCQTKSAELYEKIISLWEESLDGAHIAH